MNQNPPWKLIGYKLLSGDSQKPDIGKTFSSLSIKDEVLHEGDSGFISCMTRTKDDSEIQIYECIDDRERVLALIDEMDGMEPDLTALKQKSQELIVNFKLTLKHQIHYEKVHLLASEYDENTPNELKISSKAWFTAQIRQIDYLRSVLARFPEQFLTGGEKNFSALFGQRTELSKIRLKFVILMRTHYKIE